jgi:Sir2 family
MKEVVDAKEIPKCPSCGGLVKPDIVFFGEALPARFFDRRVDMHHTGSHPPVPFVNLVFFLSFFVILLRQGR